MCLIFLSFNDHPQYKLMVVANRDEFYKRSTAAAHYWEDHPNVLGGRDQEAGGTWMGIHRNGRFSLVTNYRDLSHIKPVAPSRGHLVSDFLTGTEDTQAYMQRLEDVKDQYNGFNLIAGTPDELLYSSNYRNGVMKIEPGVYGLSNHLFNTPWPKVKKGLDKMSVLMRESSIDTKRILDAMYDDAVAPDDELPDTGIGLEKERSLSSMFIKMSGYGTRNTTLVTIDRSDKVLFIEQVYDPETFKFSTREFSFQISNSIA